MKSVASSSLFQLLCTGVLLCACTPEPQRFDSGFLCMGTTAELSLLVPDATLAARLDQAVEAQLQQQARDWYAFSADPRSELKQLNAALAQAKPFNVSDALLGLLQASQKWHQLSDGYFDPAVAPLTVAWGFATSATPANWIPPDEAWLNQWRQHGPHFSDLRIAGHQVSSARHDLQLDLGAIAKGYALDDAMRLLQSQGASEALLNLGGQLAIAGERMASTAGSVLIRAPRGSQAIAKIALQPGESLATSGDYERSRDAEGQHLHHLFDPHTGRPVMHTQAVTVIARSATQADAASTALMAAGPDQWPRIARQMGIREVLRIDATGRIEATAALYARLRWLTPRPAAITLVTL